jgi:ubiquinone/menaquinone biosynthesis C-methylase UbiE
MAEELAFKDEAASEYDCAFAHVTAHFMPFLLRAAHIAPGMHVIDIATGTGLSAEAALAAVGPTGYVMAADVSFTWAGLSPAGSRQLRLAHR